MINRSLSSFNSQQLNGHVRRLSQKFENLFEIKTKSNEQLSSPKSQVFTSLHKSFIDRQFGNQNKRNKARILTTHSDTISIYNTNANTDSSNHALKEKSTSVIDSLLDVLSNKELIRVCKQIILGGSVGALAGSLLGQTNLKAKLVGLLATTLFTGEHIANFTQWTSFNLGKFENSNPKVSYSKSFGIIKNIDSFFADNMPTIVSFLFISILASSIKIRSYNDISSLPLIRHQSSSVVEHNINSGIPDYNTIYYSDLLSILRNYFLYHNCVKI